MKGWWRRRLRRSTQAATRLKLLLLLLLSASRSSRDLFLEPQHQSDVTTGFCRPPAIGLLLLG